MQAACMSQSMRATYERVYRTRLCTAYVRLLHSSAYVRQLHSSIDYAPLMSDYSWATEQSTLAK